MYLTPGPWKTFRKTLVVRDADKFHRVAECNEADDATLMAAAPEMLEALKETRAFLEGLEVEIAVKNHIWVKICNTITKAEGKG